METISDSALLEQLRGENNTSFQVLYKTCFPSVEVHISRNYGSRQDAEDIFQEAIIISLQKIRQENIVLTSSLKSYFGNTPPDVNNIIIGNDNGLRLNI